MESIYDPVYKEEIHVESKFNAFKANLGCASTIPKCDEDIKALMNYEGSDEDFKMLLNSVDLNELSQSDDIRPQPFDPSEISRKGSIVTVPKKALHLHTINALLEVQGKYNEGHRNRYMVYNKYKHVKMDEVDDPDDKDDLIVHDEVILAVRFYEPFTYRPNANVDSKPKLSQAFLVLGSQLLTELRDKIYCQCKFGPFYDISEDPDQPEVTEKPFDHGFFFIGDTFYNDTRKPTIDYSEVIRNWAKKFVNIRELKTAFMEETRFKDLTVRLGYSYLYQHHGCCEHLFTISEMRLITASDSLKRKNYPQLKIVSNTKNIFCMLCGVAEANIVVKDSEAHINDPTYLCINCFKSYHYIDGKKIGDFKAYRYYGNVSCMYEVVSAEAATE